MEALTQLWLWAFVIALGATVDKVWMRILRPRLASRLRLAPAQDDWHIPNAAWVGALIFTVGLGFFLKFVAPAAGY
ncbi:hypothetical protein [Alcaligenes endophyticus]|uniref:Prepilin peptidase n=1 Tax=Alcaligenes endophyticus TaxID=1929088 RepID=A0ABT8ENI4_9BURK|nr:hypothetical protein [Alcaligenes endophyticus]MCX5592848.1 hypothetical protein [Alcaligenes endophyticus]MDN4122861.1 hypothetical protein [Alcaligenes endophyticus]